MKEAFRVAKGLFVSEMKACTGTGLIFFTRKETGAAPTKTKAIQVSASVSLGYDIKQLQDTSKS